MDHKKDINQYDIIYIYMMLIKYILVCSKHATNGHV